MAEKPVDEHASKHPESPTTARELDFDEDSHEQPSRPQSQVGTTQVPKRVSFQDVSDEDDRPTVPPKARDPQTEALTTLTEAFPSVDAKVIKAVLVASGGQLEPAFNALLGMSDPDFVAEQPPAQPPRPARKHTPRSQLGQIEQDELYARQLADQYNAPSTHTGYGARGYGDPPLTQRRQQTGLKPNELYDDRDHSFFDDDLPVIKQNIQQGFEETRKTFNSWISNIAKKFDGDEEETPPPLPGRTNPPARRNYGPSQSEQLHGIRKNAERAARGGERERYDADPRVLGDDFTQLELHDNEANPADRRANRPLANPDLFKSTPPLPPQSGPVDEVDALYRGPSPTGVGSAAGVAAKNGANAKKWQPLTSIAPNPEVEDNDPFSLGDSDEETDKKVDLKPEDSERLKKTASESGASGSKGGVGDLAPAERSGSIGQKDKVAEEILTGKKG